MNVKTTIALLVLLAVGGLVWLLLPTGSVQTQSSSTARFLEKLRASKSDLREVHVQTSPTQSYTLASDDGTTWSLPGNWPVRAAQVHGVLDTLTSLSTRFRPFPFDKDKASEYGLDDEHAVVVKLRLKDKAHTLRLGEGAAMDETGMGKNASYRPTFVRVDDADEVVRVGPGVLDALRRDVDFFRKRQLFKSESVVKEDSFSKDKSTQVVASEIRIDSGETRYTLRKKDNEWTLLDVSLRKEEKDKDGKTVETWENAEPGIDRVNPQPLATMLESLTDFWAEAFWPPEKLAAERKRRNEQLAREGKPRLENDSELTGLNKPTHVITLVTDGKPMTLEIGGLARETSKTVPKTINVPQLGMQTIPQKVEEKFHFARLKGNNEIFEVKIAKLKEVAVDPAELRDPRLARFQSIDVARIEIQSGGTELVLAKDKDKWRIEKPLAAEAQSSEVMSLLDKLSTLEAKKEDILGKQALAKLGKETSVAVVKLHVEVPAKKSDDEEEKDKKVPPKIEKRFDVVFRVSAAEKQKEKFLARVEGWPRVNVIDKEAVELVQREAVAYRNRNILELKADELAGIEIKRGKDSFALARDGEGWKLAKPAEAKVDVDKVKPLVEELTRVEAIKFIAESPKVEDLDKYGLKEPRLVASLTPKDEKKATHTLHIGKQVEFKEEYYARLDNGPVFLLKKATVEAADKDALAFRAGEGWQVAASDIHEIKIAGPEHALTLKKSAQGWQLAAPYESPAADDAAKTLVDDLSGLKIEKLVADGVTDLGKYGLDKPLVKVEVTQGEKDKAVSSLSIGKPAENGDGRYARVGENKTVFLVGSKLADNLKRPALDYVSKELLVLDASAIEKLKVQSGKLGYTLTKEKDAWQIVDSPAAKFVPEAGKVRNLLDAWRKLKAEQVVEVGPKIDWKKSGLEPAEATFTVEIKQGDKATTHTLALGREVGVGRYARLDKQDKLVILNPGTLDDLALSHLEFLPRELLKIQADSFTGFERKMAGQDLAIALREEEWRMEKPQKRDADKVLLDPLAGKLQSLTAKRIAAYPAGDLKEYGLDAPTAEIVLKTEGKNHTIKLGKPVADGSDDRFARVDDGAMIVVLSGDVAKHLVQPALYFADRNLMAFGGADRVDYEKGDAKKGGRKLVFVKSSGRWTIADPVKGDAEETLSKTVENLSRLRVDEIVAEKGDLATYGLDKPTAQWQVFLGEKVKVHMLVGGPEKGSEKNPRPRRYGKLASSEQIFLLSSDMAERLLEEYRSRKPWTSLDAAQATKVTFKAPSSSFILEKMDNQWTVAGNTKAKVATSAVTDTLDALAGLKLVQFVSDGKTDAKLYGLEPPEFTIEVDLPSGKRTLHIGRTEGESKRRYAMADGVEGVFILGEADASRLTRSTDAYLEDGKP
jgi:hypothetical protein